MHLIIVRAICMTNSKITQTPNKPKMSIFRILSI